ncbi:hypothetical protein LIER_00505 [Lithospermum erythrorhizon]|uniref:Uncharacterized protein n=1 Tax=Lithospermum erythrorhizon TaxID=34254 RepID=A0AAV3NHK7_LITER
MEQGATSQLGVTTRARSGAIQYPSRGPLPQDFPWPQTKELVQTKETGEPSPRERTHDTNQEQVDESKDKDSRSHPSRRPGEKDNHRSAPSVGNLLDKDSRHDHGIDLKQSREQPAMSYYKSKLYVEEISRRDYNPRRNHRQQHRRYRKPSPFRNQHTEQRDYSQEYYSSTPDNLSRPPSRENRMEEINKGKTPVGSPETNNFQGVTRNHQENKQQVPHGEGNAGGSNDVIAKLQLQVEELNNRLRDIAPSKVLAKHSTLLPFSCRMRHEPMP